MKFILVPALIMLVLTQAFSKWFVVFEYNANRNYIANNLCVNKSKPKMHCNGKCQMMKRLADEEKQNSSNSNIPSKIKVQEVFFSDEINKVMLPLLAFVTSCYNEEPPILKHNSPISSIFHPPAIG